MTMTTRTHAKFSPSKKDKEKESSRNPKKNYSHLSPTMVRTFRLKKELGGIMPQRHFAHVTTNGGFLSGGNTVTVTGQLRVNSLLTTDSDWTAGIVAQSSFLAGVAAFYQSYRIHEFMVEVEASARQTSPRTTMLQTVALPSNPAYGTPTVDLGPGCMELSRVDTVGSIAHSPNVIRFKTPMWKISEIVPDLATKADIDYSGTISTLGVFVSPTNSVNYVWLMNQDNAAAYTANEAPFLRLRLHQLVEFFDVRPA